MRLPTLRTDDPAPDHRCRVEMATVADIARTLVASLDIRHGFQHALKVLGAHLGLHPLMLVLPDDANRCLAVHSAVGLSPEQARRGLWPVDEGWVGRVFTNGLPTVRADDEDDGFVDPTGAFGLTPGQPAAVLAVPLRASQAVLGVLVAGRRLQAALRLDDDQRLMTLVASLLAQALLLHRSVRSETERLQSETVQLRKTLYRVQGQPRYSLAEVIGQSPPMQRVYAEIHRAAPGRATVLLRGESGTGKEALARAVHGLSPAARGPFVAVNCAALSETLLESELFGHERGAFTGATGTRKGRFEQADGGTLFLDEIGDISPAFQSKLLRVLQEREFERVGGNRPIPVNVRIVCATHRDLEDMVRRGHYRADLYYRINVIAILVPPLRERRADIPALVQHFLERFAAENGRAMTLTPEALQILQGCSWPGNVRELQNCIERAATLAHDDCIRAPDVACQQDRCITHTLNHGANAGAPPSAPRS